MNINEIRYFERKMTDSAFNDAVKYDPAIAVRAKRAWVMKIQGLISFREYIGAKALSMKSTEILPLSSSLLFAEAEDFRFRWKNFS